MSFEQNLRNLVARLSTQDKKLLTLINGNAADLTGLATSAKTNLVAAVNELKASIDNLASGAAGISDTTTSANSTWSSQKTTDYVASVRDGILGGVGSAYDTLQEIVSQIQSDEGVVAGITTALGNRLRFDAQQTLTSAQQAQGQANLSVYSQAQIGDPETDLVSVYESGLS